MWMSYREFIIFIGLQGFCAVPAVFFFLIVNFYADFSMSFKSVHYCILASCHYCLGLIFVSNLILIYILCFIMSPEPYVSDIDPEASQPTSVPVDLTATQSSEDMEASCLAEIDSLEAYLEHHLNDPGSEEEEEHIYEEIEVVSQGQTACFMTQW